MAQAKKWKIIAHHRTLAMMRSSIADTAPAMQIGMSVIIGRASRA